MPSLFITGNDTGIGKTQIGAALAYALTQEGIRVQTRKPVESGCVEGPHGLFGEDSQALWQAAGQWEAMELICPYRFAAPLAPPQAAQAIGKTLHLDQLQQAAQAQWQKDALVLIEGAGGYMSPTANDGLVADLIQLMQIPVLLVVENRLGAINQCLVHLRAMQSYQCQPIAVVLNQTDELALDNIRQLESILVNPQIAVFSVNWTAKQPYWQNLDLGKLTLYIKDFFDLENI